MTLIELIAYLDQVTDEAYSCFNRYASLHDRWSRLEDWEMANRFINIHRKTWDIRVRISKDILAGVL